jgi:hypothetical protein
MLILNFTYPLRCRVPLGVRVPPVEYHCPRALLVAFSCFSGDLSLLLPTGRVTCNEQTSRHTEPDSVFCQSFSFPEGSTVRSLYVRFLGAVAGAAVEFALPTSTIPPIPV